MIENKMVNNKTKMLLCNKILHKKISRKSAHQRERREKKTVLEKKV